MKEQIARGTDVENQGERETETELGTASGRAKLTETFPQGTDYLEACPPCLLPCTLLGTGSSPLSTA